MFDIEYFLKMYILKTPFIVTLSSISLRHTHLNICSDQYNRIYFKKVDRFVLTSNSVNDVGYLIDYYKCLGTSDMKNFL